MHKLILDGLIGWMCFAFILIKVVCWLTACRRQRRLQDRGNLATAPSHSVSNCKYDWSLVLCLTCVWIVSSTNDVAWLIDANSFWLFFSPRYCDCFANGEFCNNCNCNNCFNNLEHETERLKAIKVSWRCLCCWTESLSLWDGWVKVKLCFPSDVSGPEPRGLQT